MSTHQDIKIHEVMVFNRALSKREIARLERYCQEEYGKVTLWRRVVRYLAKWWSK